VGIGKVGIPTHTTHTHTPHNRTPFRNSPYLDYAPLECVLLLCLARGTGMVLWRRKRRIGCVCVCVWVGEMCVPRCSVSFLFPKRASKSDIHRHKDHTATIMLTQYTLTQHHITYLAFNFSYPFRPPASSQQTLPTERNYLTDRRLV